MLKKLEDIWVAIAFAEAGEHEWVETTLGVSSHPAATPVQAVAETI